MKNNPIILLNFWTENKKLLRLYLLLTTITFFSIFAYFMIEGKILLATAFVGLLLSVWIVTQPKAALYQYLFVMFTNYLFIDKPVILIVDISALLVIVAALFDLLLKGEYKFTFPKLSLNFFIIIIAFCVVAFFGYNPSLSVLPILHIIYLFLTFLSLYRLSKYANLNKLLHLFFMFAIMHAFIAMLPFLGASKVERLFGFARSTLDDIMMIAFPLGLIFFINSTSKKAFLYLIALLLIIAALIATQSRLSIMFALIFGAIAIILSLMKDQTTAKISYKRIRIILIAAMSFIVLLLSAAPEYITAVAERFESLFSSSPSETFLIRIVLWTNALTTFADNPVLGIGLGHYKILHTIYSPIHLHYMFPYIQNYSAHNMFLHYLAETGIVGTTAVFALLINQFRFSWKVYKKKNNNLSETDLCLFIISLLILATSFIEAGWLWGQMSYLFIFFIVLNIRNYEIAVRKIPKL